MSSASELWQTAGRALHHYLRSVEGSVSAADPEGWLALSGAPIPETNMAFVATSQDPYPADYVKTLVDVVMQARARQTPLLVLFPQAVLDELGQFPVELGLAPVGAIPLMARTLTGGSTERPHADPALVIKTVVAAGDLAQSHALIAETFALPVGAVERYIPVPAIAAEGVDLFLARRDGETVATVLAVRIDDAVGLRFMATAPARQRQGIGRAVLERVIAHYADRGVRTIYLGTTEAGYRLYEQTGFSVVEQTPVWIAMP